MASLRLCAEAGLVKVGAVALDGTKIGANASPDANRTLEGLDKRIAAMIAEAAELDALEDQHDGPDGQAVPVTLVDPARRKAQLAAARERLEAAKARLEATAAERANRFAARAAQVNAARAAKGLAPREVKPRPRDEAPQPGATTNLTDSDSRVLRGRSGRVQGFNGQLVTTPDQIIVAAELCQDSNDLTQLAPMLAATRDTLSRERASPAILPPAVPGLVLHRA